MRAKSLSPFLTVAWCQEERSELQSLPSGGGRTSTPEIHRRHWAGGSQGREETVTGKEKRVAEE